MSKSCLISGYLEGHDRIPGPNGPHSFDTLLIPLKAPDGTVTSVLGISRDITELKKKEETLIRVNHQLNLLSEITRHDILNKMSVIIGYLTLYRKKSSDPAVLELVDKLEPPTSVIRSLIEETKTLPGSWNSRTTMA